jgi:hypothetical protein
MKEITVAIKALDNCITRNREVRENVRYLFIILYKVILL